MTDKRQEFINKWQNHLEIEMDGHTGYPAKWQLRDLLAAYDKLNGDNWERLKKCVKDELYHAESIIDDDWYFGRGTTARAILAEIERLEKEGE